MRKRRALRSVCRLLLLAAVVVLVAGCATTPVARREHTVSPPTAPTPPAATPSNGPGSPGTPRSASPPAGIQPPLAQLPTPALPAPPAKRPTRAAAPNPPQPATKPSAAAAASGSATAILKGMTLEEKVGQLFILQLYDRKVGRYYRRAEGGALTIIERFHPGGVILFGGNLDTIDQAQAMIRGVQATSKLPLFVAVDEEGGEVSRLTASGKIPAAHMPAAEVVGATHDPLLAYREGRYVGRELLSLGINMDLAPVADVDTNPANRVIGSRAFSSSPQVAARMTSAMVRGLQSVQVSSVIKHFPGHGDTSTDSHLGAAVVHHSLGRLERVEFLPFRAGIAAGADGVLIGHLLLPEVLPDKEIPASFSPFILGHILRKQLKFKKLIITDALNMGAIVDYWNAATAALDAFEAGADMLLMPADPAAAYAAILDAVRSGEITEARLDESVRRILLVKLKRGIIGPPLQHPDPLRVIGSPEGREIVNQIRAEAAKKSGR